MQYRWPEAKTEIVLHPGFINNYGRKAFWNGEQCFYTRFNRTQVLRPRTVTGHATTKSHQGNSTQTQACPVLVVVTMDNQVPEVVVDRYSYHKCSQNDVWLSQNACNLLIFAAHISPAVTSYDHALISETFFDLLVLLTFLMICWWRNFWSTVLTTGVNKLLAVSFLMLALEADLMWSNHRLSFRGIKSLSGFVFLDLKPQRMHPSTEDILSMDNATLE